MRSNVALALVFGVAPASVGAAQDVDQEAVRQARLTLSAFECFALAEDATEQKRLFTLGYETGTAFLERVSSSQPNQATRRQLPILWLATNGPTVDFILGQVFSAMVESAFEGLGTDENERKVMTANRYQEKNCALIGK